jgi:hypothetical protein
VSRIFQVSTVNALKPILSNFNESEKVDFLLKFTQLSFKYRHDNRIFGTEHWFYPEEMVHYDYSDCEDRSIFFSYLVSTLTDYSILGLKNDSHVFTAVEIPNSPIKRHVVEFTNAKYVICDPTYIGAPLGKIDAKILQRGKPEIVYAKWDREILEGELGFKINSLDTPQPITLEPRSSYTSQLNDVKSLLAIFGNKNNGPKFPIVWRDLVITESFDFVRNNHVDETWIENIKGVYYQFPEIEVNKIVIDNSLVNLYLSFKGIENNIRYKL